MSKNCKKRSTLTIKAICLDCINLNPKGKIRYKCIIVGRCPAKDLTSKQIGVLLKKQDAI